MAGKKFKCPTCKREWVADEDQDSALIITCPGCGEVGFENNFTEKKKEEHRPKYSPKPLKNPEDEEKKSEEQKTQPRYAPARARASLGGGVSSTKKQSKGRIYSYIKETKPETRTYVRKEPKRVEKEPSVVSELTSGCFIVTATYGTESYEKIDVFYRFRDEFLLKSALGAAAARAYYLLGRYPAKLIKNSKTLRRASRFFLDRLAGFLEKRL